MIHVIGVLGATISFVLWLPQARSTWRARRDPRALSAISVWTQLLVALNAVVWFVYAGLLGEFWVGAPGIVNLPLALLTVYLVLRARRVQRALPPQTI